ncbi:MAG: sigma-70 family RNA polymerase sigma factor [Caldithrix sp.]|nr:MAG: sigma-70 family RNA polymerase sigma factor [Caldithrix sp.]
MLQAAIRLNKNKNVFQAKKNDESGSIDWELVQRCRKGERKAQYELYQLYKDRVFNIAYRMANSQQDAEDITQMAFVRVFQKIDSFRGDSAFSSWVYRLTVNICINHFRREKRKKELVVHELSELATNLKILKTNEQTSKMKPFLEKAIRALPAGYRMIFVLYDIEGYKHEEIAEMMNISEGTSKSQLHKARKELKQYLEPYLAMYQSLA